MICKTIDYLMDKSITRHSNQNIIVVDRKLLGNLISMTVVSRLCQAVSTHSGYNNKVLTSHIYDASSGP